ncbi:adenosine deaminase [Corynebacterium freneyi]|uniref:adenosine deaminase n=1 Tax=Corynebacterium freneyi DNF00450 TaxID=1287475 RepID=A0A096A7C1_9CORY|nr:adenosine deaminase [Corynebacterium freneyi]KGF16769.1 adenosine deaminase [Corynebacterium freneyi DNF00450]MDK8769066.1 adenosine deaminase [Corynebacterium freneyi]
MHNSPEMPLDPLQVEANVVADLPKVVLHDHLTGGMRPSTLVELAAQAGYDGLPSDDPEEVARWFVEAGTAGSLPGHLEAFAHTTAVTQTAESLTRVAREAVEDLAGDRVVYAELRIAPELHVDGGLSMQEVVDAVVEGLSQGERAAGEAGHDITARLILSAMRDRDRTVEVAQLLVDNLPDNTDHDYVVAFDLAGPEEGNSPDRHAEAFALLRDNLAPVTIHAGEGAGLESVRAAVVAGANRIGHGPRVFEDLSASMDGIELQRLSGHIRDRCIPLELCPTSNVQTGIVDAIADHPFPLLDDLGFTCTVNTGNRLLSGTTMTREMMILVEVFDYGYTELFQLTCNAIESAFADLPTRERILDTLIYPPYLELTDQDGDGEIDPCEDEQLTIG